MGGVISGIIADVQGYRSGVMTYIHVGCLRRTKTKMTAVNIVKPEYHLGLLKHGRYQESYHFPLRR